MQDHPNTLTGDSFFHLAALGDPLPGLNLCGAGRVVCLIDPIGDVYACPFVLHPEFRAGSVRDAGGFTAVWRASQLFASLREPQAAGACASCGSYDACQGGCMAAKFFTGLPLDGPDPECVLGHGELALLGASVVGASWSGPFGAGPPRREAVSLLDPLDLGSRRARNRIVFGPHETNLGRRRALSDRHVAYYRRRAVGGAGVIVVEEASVHRSDWPYERSPLCDGRATGLAGDR